VFEEEFRTLKKIWRACCSTLAYSQHNRLRLSHSVYNSWRHRRWDGGLLIVDNSCGLTRSRTGGRVNICTYFALETKISP